MILASYEYQPNGVPFIMVLTLIGLVAFAAWKVYPEGAQWWRSPFLSATIVFGTLSYLFISWASATS